MIGLGFFVFGVVVIILISVLIAGCVLLLNGFRVKSLPQKLIGVLLCGISLLPLAAFATANYSYSQPHNIFDDTFGFHASADVSGLEASRSGFMDYEDRFLKFQTSQKTVDKIIVRGMAKAKPAYSVSTNALKPSWWKPPIDEEPIRYVGDNLQGTFYQEKEVLIYYPSSNTAYFWYSGLD